MREMILDLLSKKGDLPPFPEVLRKLQEMINDPNSSIAKIEKVIELDPVLSGSILKLSNSAFYGLGRQKVEKLSLAINKLGLKTIKQIAFSLKLTGLFNKKNVLNYLTFWRHSLSVAISSQHLSRYTNIPKQLLDIAYLSGLMHDVGIMVFSYLIPEKYESFLHTLEEKEEPIQIREKEHFGIDHQELGALFIEKWWKVNPKIIHTVRYHHFPFQGTEEEQQCAQLINVADGLCNNSGFSNGIDCFHEVFKEGAWENLGLSLSDAESIIEDVRNAVDQAVELLKL